MSTNIKTPKKLIEVALPLDDINFAAAKEKSVRHGHPSTLHLWWARRPLAAARAVLFAQLVNDPSYQQGGGFKFGVNKKRAAIKREKLFEIMRDLVQWKNTNNADVLSRAREAIKESWKETCHLNSGHPQAAELFNSEKLPAFHDPFSGGGAIPLEAQRLGLESFASDLNPVSVMINKAMIEIPPKFSGHAPVGPLPDGISQFHLVEDWSGAKGMAEDILRYGHWMNQQLQNRLGHQYPKVTVASEITKTLPNLKPYEGQQITVIAWIWARTVKSPSPAFNDIHVPLISNYYLSAKPGREAYVEPIVNGNEYRFSIINEKPINLKEVKKGNKLSGRAKFKCILSGATIDSTYIKEQGKMNAIGVKLTAMIAEADDGSRFFLPPIDSQEKLALDCKPDWLPNFEFAKNSRHMTPFGYGLDTFDKLFSNRQIALIAALSDLIPSLVEKIKNDVALTQLDPEEYAHAIALYLSFAISKGVDYWNNLCTWRERGSIDHLFSRQAIPMVWDYAEANPLAQMHCSWLKCVDWVSKAVYGLGDTVVPGHSLQKDAISQDVSANKVVSTDPPYYDNVPYADLSDFFYVWLRKSLRSLYPDLLSTILVPKGPELVADSFRHKGKDEAEQFFLKGMTGALHRLGELAHEAFPITIYYAFKQAEKKNEDTASTGWETFLEAVARAGFEITGTWPINTEMSSRIRGIGANALASSIVLVCRKRDADARSISRRDFQRELRNQMPEALEIMIGGGVGQSPIAPVDLAQAAIGPGMGIFSQYKSVLNQDGSKMSVHDALVLINREITDYLNPDSGSFDNDTLFCDNWFAEYGWAAGKFGQAIVLAQAKGTTVDGVQEAGVIESGGGMVRLLRWQEYPSDWDPKQDNRTPVWEALHHLIRALNEQGESGAGKLLASMPERGEPIRQLAYHLYTLCEQKKWAEDARAYNELITAWHATVTASLETGHVGSQTNIEF